MNAYKNPTDSTKFILTEPFPGEYQFTNPDMPTLDHAAIFDTDGDGIGDSIATWFGGKTDSMDVKTFKYSWPDDKSLKRTVAMSSRPVISTDCPMSRLIFRERMQMVS